ncbi:LysR family transcriptional regulator [Roseivivax sediminis]|uniref:DNA-binding transcriptional regulator, LysR family n=1 Tax=Roseivivax sediminis TaxID=936889 RepID=A0A1I2AF57_9RHOB|nr:LysR family transcriptional regulator [Roseivivax sediminis]SFE42178.1 DNA-binding transcriptional regulator, LysR family [Roseivivax sediminis]
MIDLKDLRCLSALARHKHFARAANECGISQPAFSMRIRKIEDRLQTPIVRRGNRFQGLTEDGMMIVRHARTIIDEVELFEQEFRCQRGQISGSLKLGVIPTAVGYVSLLLIELNRQYPDIVVRLETASSLAIQQGLEDGRYDAGITYTDGAPADLLHVEPLYDEAYMLLVPRALAPREEGEIAWAEAAQIPLTLLEPAMQNRRIIDQIFAQAGATPHVVAETSGFTSSIVMAVQGLSATVLPRVLVDSLGPLSGVVALPLVDPVQEKSVCLVSAFRETGLPTLEALRSVAEQAER